jgi:Na+/H+ antiporter
MLLFELVIGLLLLGAVLALWSERIGAPYPALLALVGALIALVPGVPEVTLDPELALTLFVAPTLLDAAYDSSPRDLRRNLVAVTSLAVVMVVLTVAAVAWVARLVVPELSWASAIALGAIVAPPDASAATTVLRKLQPPHRLLVILEGESLFNDATSLLIYRVAVGAAMTGAFNGWSVLPMLLLTCGGGLVAGWALARLYMWLVARVDDIPVSVLLQFISTFAVWMLAERMGLSAIITMVAYAMTLARRVPGHMTARHRLASYTVWDVAVLVLNVLAFVLIGLQVRAITSRVTDWRTYTLCALAACAAVIVVRAAWIMSHTCFDLWRLRRSGETSAHPLSPPTIGNGVLASWCGMRGIVTLATALALPSGSAAFPHRDLVVFSAFCVVLSTLVLQGLTLRPLMRWLRLHDDGTVERETKLARTEIAQAALRELETANAPARSTELLRSEYRARLNALPQDEEGFAALQRQAALAQRAALSALRAQHVIGDAAFHVLEEELDLLELSADVRVLPGPGKSSDEAAPARVDGHA